MPRRPRVAPGGLVYHVLTRANGRARIFDDEGDYAAFVRIIGEALKRRPLELFAWILMPNHWHLVLRPLADGDLSEFMRWLTLTHTHRWHAHRLWQRENRQAQMLSPWPVEFVNQPQTVAEEDALQLCIRKGRPFGSEMFEEWTAEMLGLESAFRERGEKKVN